VVALVRWHVWDPDPLAATFRVSGRLATELRILTGDGLIAVVLPDDVKLELRLRSVELNAAGVALPEQARRAIARNPALKVHELCYVEYLLSDDDDVEIELAAEPADAGPFRSTSARVAVRVTHLVAPLR